MKTRQPPPSARTEAADPRAAPTPESSADPLPQGTALPVFVSTFIRRGWTIFMKKLPDRLLLFRDVMRLTGWSDEALRRAIRENRFPPPMHLNKRRLAWRPEVIETHLRSLERAALANQEGTPGDAC